MLKMFWGLVCVHVCLYDLIRIYVELLLDTKFHLNYVKQIGTRKHISIT